MTSNNASCNSLTVLLCTLQAAAEPKPAAPVTPGPAVQYTGTPAAACVTDRIAAPPAEPTASNPQNHRGPACQPRGTPPSGQSAATAQQHFRAMPTATPRDEVKSPMKFADSAGKDSSCTVTRQTAAAVGAAHTPGMAGKLLPTRPSASFCSPLKQVNVAAERGRWPPPVATGEPDT